MHCGIQNFVWSIIMLQTINPLSFELELLPFCVMKMLGGVNSHDRIQSLMQCMAKVLEVKNNAHIKILQHKSFSDVTPSEIPVYFKLGELTDVKVE